MLSDGLGRMLQINEIWSCFGDNEAKPSIKRKCWIERNDPKANWYIGTRSLGKELFHEKCADTFPLILRQKVDLSQPNLVWLPVHDQNARRRSATSITWPLADLANSAASRRTRVSSQAPQVAMMRPRIVSSMTR